MVLLIIADAMTTHETGCTHCKYLFGIHLSILFLKFYIKKLS